MKTRFKAIKKASEPMPFSCCDVCEWLYFGLSAEFICSICRQFEEAGYKETNIYAVRRIQSYLLKAKQSFTFICTHISPQLENEWKIYPNWFTFCLFARLFLFEFIFIFAVLLLNHLSRSIDSSPSPPLKLQFFVSRFVCFSLFSEISFNKLVNTSQRWVKEKKFIDS